MISRLRGKLVRKDKDKILLKVANITYEIFLPKTVYNRIEEYLENGEIELVIYHYYQVEYNRYYPILIGFLNDLEKEFFESFLRVSGIGPRAALRALEEPISKIAEAIEEGDLNFLKNLEGIGTQRAKNIIACLQGRMGRFTLIKDKERKEKEEVLQEEIIEEAYEVLRQLQYKKSEAKDMIKRALKANPQIKTLEELLNEIYRQKVKL